MSYMPAFLFLLHFLRNITEFFFVSPPVPGALTVCLCDARTGQHYPGPNSQGRSMEVSSPDLSAKYQFKFVKYHLT